MNLHQNCLLAIDYLLHISSIIFLLAVFMPFVKFKYWWIRFFDFPHAQFTAFGSVLCLLYFLKAKNTLDWVLLILSLIALMYCLWIIYPYTWLSKKKSLTFQRSVSNYDTVSLLTANVYMPNENFEGLKKLIELKKPDLILLLECDEKWSNAVEPIIKETYPYQVTRPLPNTYGILFYSKYKLHEAEVRFIVEDDVPSIHAAIELQSGRKVQFFGIHPRPPAPGENERSLERDAELIKVGRLVKASNLPCIVAGDLNDVAWSHTTRLFTRISGLLDPRIGRGFFNTFHAKLPLLRWPLDHVFLDYHFKVRKIQRLESFESDHFPIFIDLVFEPDKDAFENKEKPDLADRIEADEVIDKVEL